MEYLGVSKQTDYKIAVVLNFLIVFAAQLVFKLVEMLPGYPSFEDFYGAIITALGVTFIIYGINKRIIEPKRNANK